MNAPARRLTLAEEVARMEAVDRAESKRAFDRVEVPTAPPSPRIRTCPECFHFNGPKNSRHPFNDDWTCSCCGVRSVKFVEFDECPDCKLRRRTMYTGNAASVVCGCGLPPEDLVGLAAKQATEAQAFREAAEAERREQEIAHELAQARRKQQDDTKHFAELASACWRQREQRCKISKRLQMPFCVACPRFKR